MQQPTPPQATASPPLAPPGVHFEPRQKVFLWLAALQVTALIVANMIGVKLFSIDVAGIGVEHTAGMLPFPITFLLTDLLNEFYGKKATRMVAWMAFGMAIFAFIMVSLARLLPILEGIPGTSDERSFETVFGSSALMTLSSIVAFLFGSMIDIAIFGFFKRITHGRMVWLRATGSTVVSQLFDSFIITILYFQVAQALTGGEVAGFDFVLRTALTGYVLKFVIAVVLTPAIYGGRAFLRRVVKLEPLPA